MTGWTIYPGTGVYNEGFANPSKQIFYQDPMTGVFDGQYAGTGLDAYYAETAGLLKKAQKRAGKLEKAVPLLQAAGQRRRREV